MDVWYYKGGPHIGLIRWLALLVLFGRNKMFFIHFSIWVFIFPGDPLFPFLITIVVEALSSLLVKVNLVKVREFGVIEGFDMGWSGEGWSGEAIIHLQFADGAIPFSFSRREEILALRKRCF